MTGPDSDGVVDVIARRDGVLRALGPTPVEKRELVERLDVSRSTVDRGVRELEAAGLAARSDGGYRRTPAGDLALAEYDAFVRRAGGAVEHADLLASLPPDADVDAAMVADADAVVADRRAPHAPTSALASVVADADRVRARWVAAFPRQVDAYASAVTDGAEAEVILAPAAARRLVSEHASTVAAALDTGRLAVREAPDEPPFGLLVAETPDGPVAGMLIVGDAGVEAFVENRTDDAVAWARDRLASAWERATPIPDPGSAGAGGG